MPCTSDTAMAPSAPAASPVTKPNSEVPLAVRPNSNAREKSLLNTWMRPFPVSDTTMRPLPSAATPRGEMNWPGASPLSPNVRRCTPSLSMTTILWLSVSATMMRPSGSDATPLGPSNRPNSPPVYPNSPIRDASRCRPCAEPGAGPCAWACGSAARKGSGCDAGAPPAPSAAACPPPPYPPPPPPPPPPPYRVRPTDFTSCHRSGEYPPGSAVWRPAACPSKSQQRTTAAA